MLKNTVTGSVLAKLFPTMAKHFLENASQEEVNKAEQEAAVVHQQMQGNGTGEVSASTVLAGETTSAQMPLEVPAPVAGDIASQLTAVTKRATTAEAKVTDLQGKLTAAEADRDRYKAWYDKQAVKGTALPGADATTRGGSDDTATLSAASQEALAVFRKRKANA